MLPPLDYRSLPFCDLRGCEDHSIAILGRARPVLLRSYGEARTKEIIRAATSGGTARTLSVLVQHLNLDQRLRPAPCETVG